MRIVFYILLGIHGIIHSFGFLKAFKLAEFGAIAQPVSRTAGIFWLLTAILIIAALILNITGNKYWWVLGVIAAVISQTLIITVWQDAKFGTIMNIIILIACFLAYSNQHFTNLVSSERVAMLTGSKEGKNTRSIAGMPLPVQKWLTNSGITDSTKIKTVYLTQKAQLKMKPDQKNWYSAEADQYFVTNPPSFNWSVRLNMNPFLPVIGRDKFEDGKGEMQIKLFSAFPVVNARDNKKIDQATLQRFLAEIVWFPSAALNEYLHWEEIDDQTARATMTWKGTSGSGTFHFDKEGNFKKFSAMRYDGGDESSELKEWVIHAIDHKQINGIKIPVKLEVSWQLEEGKWTWLKLEITDIMYNVFVR